MKKEIGALESWIIFSFQKESFGLFQEIIDALADVRNFEARIGHDSGTHAQNDWHSSELEKKGLKEMEKVLELTRPRQ